jgi:transcriptional regulator with XRE-family HTH domain
MNTIRHWTQESAGSYVYSISSSYTSQLESRMEEKHVSRSQLAELLGKSTGRISQVLNDPGNLGLKVIVEYARALGLKVSIVAYDDNDPTNERGPINPDVFVRCWENANCPADLFEVAEKRAVWPVGPVALTGNVYKATAPVYQNASNIDQIIMGNPLFGGYGISATTIGSGLVPLAFLPTPNSIVTQGAPKKERSAA